MSDLARSAVRDDRTFLFDRLTPGERIGSTSFVVDAAMLNAWQRLYGSRPGDAPLPLAFAPMLVMRAFLAIVAPRPPGNLHVGQSYRVRDMPRPDREIFAVVECLTKEVRKSRRVVRFGIDLSEGEGMDPFVSGESTMFWAA